MHILTSSFVAVLAGLSVACVSAVPMTLPQRAGGVRAVPKGGSFRDDLVNALIPPTKPQQPTWGQLQQNARHFPPRDMHPDWEDYLFLP